MTAAQRRRRRNAAERYEARLAEKRKRFRYVTEAIPLYERPCGCPNGNYIPNGVYHFQYSSLVITDRDVSECRQCGATWTQADIEPTLDRFRREMDLAMEARDLGYRLVPIVTPMTEKDFIACSECGDEDADDEFAARDATDRFTYEHGEKWAPSYLGSHDVPLPKCSTCHGTCVVEIVNCSLDNCSGFHPCETCKGTGTLYNLA